MLSILNPNDRIPQAAELTCGFCDADGEVPVRSTMPLNKLGSLLNHRYKYHKLQTKLDRQATIHQRFNSLSADLITMSLTLFLAFLGVVQHTYAHCSKNYTFDTIAPSKHLTWFPCNVDFFCAQLEVCFYSTPLSATP